MFRSLLLPRFWRFSLVVLFLCLSIFGNRLCAQTPPPAPPPQDTSGATDSTAKPAPAPASGDSQEVSSRDTPTTFKVRVNLVLVRVVVRDAQGKVVPGLKKENFQLYDNRKLQTISSFSVEAPEARTASMGASSGAEGSSSSLDPVAGKATVLPQRFVSMVFDDVHLSMEDATFVRDSATRFFGSLAASDRASINTTSGQLTQEFTDDHRALEKALLGIVPRSLTSRNLHDCPEVSYYQAELIVNRNDTQAFAVAADEALQCAFGGDPNMTAAARNLAQIAADRALVQATTKHSMPTGTWKM